MNDSLILTLCLQENTLLISNALIEQLGAPSLMQVRISESDKSLLVQPCEYGVRGAIVIPENRSYQLEIPADTLMRRIRRLTAWTDDNPRVLCGVYIPQLNAVYFSLDDAQYAILQPAPGTQTDAALDVAIDETMASTLPMREGPEASVASQSDTEDDMPMDEPVYGGDEYALAGVEGGDLNG